MAVYDDPTLPLHPLTVAHVTKMVEAGILDEDGHVELLDGVLVEMSPQGSPHAYAIRRLDALAGPVAAAAGLELSIRSPLDVRSRVSLPEPDATAKAHGATLASFDVRVRRALPAVGVQLAGELPQ